MPQINERVVDFLVLPIKEGIVEVIQPGEHAVVKAFLEERVSERIVEQIVFEGSVLVPPAREEIVSVVQFSKHVMVPPIKQAFASRARPGTHRGTAGGYRRASDQTGNRISSRAHPRTNCGTDCVDTPMPPDKEEIAAAVPITPNERY